MSSSSVSIPFSGDCGREQLFQEVVDRLEQDHIKPILRRVPPAPFSPGEHPLDDKHGKRGRKEIESKSEGLVRAACLLLGTRMNAMSKRPIRAAATRNGADVAASDLGLFIACSHLYPWFVFLHKGTLSAKESNAAAWQPHPLCSFKQKYVTDHSSPQLLVRLPLK